jgi:hypothetical protein
VVEQSKIKGKNADLKALWGKDIKKPNVHVQQQVNLGSVQGQQHVPSSQVQQQGQSSSPQFSVP